MENFKLNGRVYKAREVDFNFVAMLGENGISVTDITKKILPSLRVYVAFCMNSDDLEMAGSEINLHIINGGALDDISAVFVEKLNDSDFFQALSNRTNNEESATGNRKGNTKKSQKEAVVSE